jgi:hypothetical protein
MATTSYALSDFNSALKQVIEPYIQDNIPSDTKLLKVLKRNENTEYFNNAFYAPIRSSRHGGIVNLANENAKLRTGSSAITQGSVSPKLLSATFDISDVVKTASANSKGAVENAMTFQMKTLKSDFARNINRQYFSDGVGVLAQVPTSGSVGVGTLAVIYPDTNLDDARGDASGWYGPVNYDIKPTKYFAVGQAVGIGTAAADVGTITAITGGTAQGTLVVTGAPAVNNADAVYIVDGDENAAGTSEIQGIRAALSVGTSNYAGLARSLDIWSPQYLGTASNAALSINDMEAVYMSALEYAQSGDRYAWFVNKSLYTKYGDLLTALRRTVDKTELVSGWSGLSFEAGQGNVGVFLDYDVPDGEAILLNLDTWTVCQIADMGFVEDNTLRRSDYITFQKVFSWYTNLFCVAPAANGRLVRRTK